MHFCMYACVYTCMYVCIYVGIYGYGVDLPSTTTTLKESTSLYLHNCLCISEHNSGREGYGDGYRIDPCLNHHYPLQGEQVCVFVNTIQKGKEIDIERDME